LDLSFSSKHIVYGKVVPRRLCEQQIQTRIHLEAMKDRVPSRQWDWIIWLTLGFGLLATVIGLLRNRLRQAQRHEKSLPSELTLDLQQFQGLSEAEAIERHSPVLAQKQEQAARQVRRDIWRSRTLSIFNLSLLALAAVRALLGDPLGAWLTLGILILNIALNVIQQMMATRRLEQLMVQTRPQATAIRDGRTRSIDVDEIVIDDLLVIGPGDEFLANGEILEGKPEVAEVTAVSGESNVAVKGRGDLIQAGSYCIQGRAVYKVTNLPEDLGNQKWTPVVKKTELTPLQRIISRILRLMLIFIAIFLALLLLDWFNSPLLSRVFEAKYREAVSIIFSISANGLFFMIIASYALGSARLGGEGVLIRESRALESLAQVSVLCVSKTGTLTSTQVTLDMFPSVNGFPIWDESRVRQILGDFAHSTPAENLLMRDLSDNLGGNKRPVEQSAWLLSAYGWSAVTFSEAEVGGTYVIGEPAILRPHLATVQAPEEEETLTLVEAGSANGNLRQRLGVERFSRFFRRSDEMKEDVADDPVSDVSSTEGIEVNQKEYDPTDSSPAVEPDVDASESPVSGHDGIFQGLLIRLNRFRNATRDPETEDAQEPEPSTPAPQLFFAYAPEPVALYDTAGWPQLPTDLIAVCTLTFQERIQPQTVEVARTFTEAGVKIKILSSDDPIRMLDAAERLGLIGDVPAPQSIISGMQLAEMSERQFEQAVKGATILGQLNSEQKGRIVRTLRRYEERVTMVGDRVDDVPAMEAANLSIALRSGSQAALSTADIVLLENSLEVLPTMLQQGQRIVNGLLDILKINLTQIGYILLLILVMVATGRRVFYYHPTHGGIISFFTVIIPTVGLTLWSSAQALPVQFMRSRLAHFVVPAAITMAATTLVVNQITGPLHLNTPLSQLAVTYGLIVIGLLLIFFVQPPTRFWVGGDVFSGDRRIVIMVIVLFLLFMAVTYVPLTQDWFRLGPLNRVQDYAVIIAASVVWTILVRLIWRSPWLRKQAGILSNNPSSNGDLSN
jgi:magnesium-transporting ATPase (P-type)